jgi:plastocyanin
MVGAVQTHLPLVAVLTFCALVALPALAKDHKVSIADVKFSPASVTIKKGDTVIWINGDERDHTVTADDGSFNSGNLGNGKTYRRKFEKPGKYKYHCEYHPRMKATVVVEE